MSKQKLFCFVILMTILLASVCLADVKLPAVISDSMVLQQKSDALIWGWANPNEQVKIKPSWSWFGKSTKADENGKWKVKIKTPKAGGPYEINIKGDNQITLTDVLIGEVWICSGQSNMGWPMRAAKNAETEIPNANYPNIRLFFLEKVASSKPLEDCNAVWAACSPESVKHFSAVAYFFGKEVHKETNVPIGLIETAWGGTIAEAWTKRDVLEADPDYAPTLDRHKVHLENFDENLKKYNETLAQWKKDVETAKAKGEQSQRKPWAPAGVNKANFPSYLFNAMINPLTQYKIKGAIWYQGEGNAHRAYQYRKLFPDMINCWRNQWSQGDFPFYYVQIAPWHYGDPNSTACPELQEAQTMTLELPNTGMAVITDIGDIVDIHPKNKLDVGKRLAAWALNKDYGFKNIPYSGPMFKAMETSGNEITLHFDFAENGLMAKDGELKEFTIAGEDKAFHQAVAKICGNTVIVSSKEVDKPIAVRFAWRNIAQPNLFNTEDLPASPFRTDDWPGVTVNNK